MISIVFGLGTAIFFATSGLLSSRAVKQIPSWSVVAWTMVIGLVIVVPFVLRAGVPEGLTSSDYGWLAASGIGKVVGLVLSAFALRIGKVGVVMPIIATEGAISALIAAARGESIEALVGLLLLVIVAGVVLAASAPDPAPLANERPVRAALLAAAAALVFGVALYSSGHLSAELPIAWVLLPARLIGFIVLTIPLAATRRLEITRTTAPLVVGMGVAEVVGFTLFAIGAQYQVAVTSVLASQFAPIAAVMAFVLFRERLGRLQVLGVAIIVIGVSLLTLAST